jgi:4,5-DOPA dioxygenase extradiol
MPVLLAAPRHAAIYDFGGFDPKLSTLRYDAPGAPQLAPRVAALLAAAGIAVQTVAEGVLVLGSGSITHNLRRVFANGLRAPVDQPEIPESAAFRRWFHAQSGARRWDALFAYRRESPHAVDMHPTDEHLLPWFVAAGAGGREAVPVRLHDGVTLGSLGMDAYAFGPGAGRLAAALEASTTPA